MVNHKDNGLTFVHSCANSCDAYPGGKHYTDKTVDCNRPLYCHVRQRRRNGMYEAAYSLSLRHYRVVTRVGIFDVEQKAHIRGTLVSHRRPTAAT